MLAREWAKSEGRGYPSDYLCPDADINFRYAFNDICYEAYNAQMEIRRKEKKK